MVQIVVYEPDHKVIASSGAAGRAVRYRAFKFEGCAEPEIFAARNSCSVGKMASPADGAVFIWASFSSPGATGCPDACACDFH